MTNKTRLTTYIVLALVVGLGIGSLVTTAVASGTLQSQGKLVYNNPETNEVVIIDTNDHQLLQDEIDLMGSNYSNLASQIGNLKTGLTGGDFYIGTSSQVQVSLDQLDAASYNFKEIYVPYTTPAGYKPIAIVGFTTTTGGCSLSRMLLEEGRVNAVIRNNTVVAEYPLVYFQILFVKTS